MFILIRVGVLVNLDYVNQNFISNEVVSSTPTPIASLDQDDILDQDNIIVFTQEDIATLLSSDSSDVNYIDYTEQFTRLENNLQVLNCICILMACVVVVSGFIKIFNKFFCFDMI